MQLKPFLRHLRDVANSMRGVKVGDVAFRLPLGVNVRMDELWMRDVIAEILPETDGIFLDVGVNLGQTLLKLRSLDRSRHYVGFEPNVDCVSAVRRIIAENDIKYTTVIPAACSRNFGVSRLFHYADSRFDSTASMVPSYRNSMQQRGSSIIMSASGQACFESLGIDCLGLVKIDVEGFEADVLEDIEANLARDNPPVLIEVLPIGDSLQRQTSADRIMRLLSRLHYEVLRIDKDSTGHFSGFTKQDRVGMQNTVEESDFLLKPT